ncbi:MAG: hypothetical protein QNK40_07995 [Desulfobacterales bacterium]|nr:hypothetical protein [Desulfobacterales bacterium]
MAFFDTMISEVSIILSQLSEITGLTPIVLICAFTLLVLLFIFGLVIFIEFKRIRKILKDVNQRFIVLGLKLEQPSLESNLAKIARYKKISNPIQDKFYDSNKQFDVIQQARTALPAQDKFLKHSSEGLISKLPSQNIDNTTNINIENLSDPLTSNTELKSAILKLIKASDLPLSLNHIVGNLPGELFDGNYHPILNELGQLEKEGQVQGTSKGGKAYYRKT